MIFITLLIKIKFPFLFPPGKIHVLPKDYHSNFLMNGQKKMGPAFARPHLWRGGEFTPVFCLWARLTGRV